MQTTKSLAFSEIESSLRHTESETQSRRRHTAHWGEREESSDEEEEEVYYGEEESDTSESDEEHVFYGDDLELSSAHAAFEEEVAKTLICSGAGDQEHDKAVQAYYSAYIWLSAIYSTSEIVNVF